MTLITVLLFLLFTIDGVGCICPDGCACTEKSVVCSCNDSPWSPQAREMTKTSLKLTAFTTHIDFTRILVIHSCDLVVIPNDTFKNVDILDQIKIMAVGQVEIHPHAFRGIRTCPRQFVIQDSYIPQLPNYAFNGLSNMDHLWLRNVSIGKISKIAFANLSNIQYIYFRDAAIRFIESGAFAHMKNITYFYMREKILCREMGDFLFIGSTFNEVIIEKAHLHSTDLTFVGLHSYDVQLRNVKLTAKRTAKLSRIPTQKIKRFRVQNSVINRLILSLLYNTSIIEFHKVKISHFLRAPNLIPQNIEDITFRESIITHWHSHAISSGKGINSITLELTSIDRINRHGIHASEIDSINVINSRVDTIDSNAFSRNDFNVISINGSSINSLGKHSMAGSQVQNLTMTLSEINYIDGEGFGFINSTLFILEQNEINSLPESLFKSSMIDELLVKNCTFGGVVSEDSFNGLMVNKLNVIDSSFNCSESPCEFNSMLFKSSINSMAWNFERNRCLSSEDVCVEEKDYEPHPGIKCRKRKLIVECICSDESVEPVFWMADNVTVVTIGDCKRLKIVKSENENPSIQVMYLYRIELLDIASVDPSLNQLHVLHSHVYFSQSYGLSFLNLYNLNFIGTFIHNIAPLAFTSTTVDYLLINETTIRSASGNSFSNAQIDSIEIFHSNIFSFGNWLERTRELRARNSFLHDMYGIENVTEICLVNNSINCACVTNPSPFQILCESISSQCLEFVDLDGKQRLGCEAQLAPLEVRNLLSSTATYNPRYLVSLVLLVIAF
ncbi:unnamed protein product [Bursaphelenchus xylophilus]|uniref:(pine wood nematode) hypothetical protein n=1 Tax=Bursaphelenchus xylophilus TaxID=6326 RepID=A0A1I7SSR6_BURXY|nr:unnamed protein product [Bursaphelenchus xylophilus]CAG9108907.1 unnamed protein product [Bursaphelenchus xylophilus]